MTSLSSQMTTERHGDNYRSLSARAKGELGSAMNNEDKLREAACKKWIDVRAFGQVFAFKSEGKKKGKQVGESGGGRG